MPNPLHLFDTLKSLLPYMRKGQVISLESTTYPGTTEEELKPRIENTRFIELAGEVNSNMPEYVVSKVAEGLNRHKKSINGSRILILGIAYKKNVDDMRESPSVEIMLQLQNLGAIVEYSDHHVPVFPAMRNYLFDLESRELTADALMR